MLSDQKISASRLSLLSMFTCDLCRVDCMCSVGGWMTNVFSDENSIRIVLVSYDYFVLKYTRDCFRKTFPFR